MYEKSIEGAYRDANNNGVIKFSAGYFASHDLSKGSRKAPPGTTIKLKVGGTGAPLVDHTREDPGSKARSGHCMPCRLLSVATADNRICSRGVHQGANGCQVTSFPETSQRDPGTVSSRGL